MEAGLVEDGEGRRIGAARGYEPHLRVGYYREVEDEAFAGVEIPVLFADEHLVIADKPPFVPVTPGGRFVRGCVLYRLEEQLGISGLAPVHRLDRMTSGLVLFARRREERGAYGSLFAQGRVERVYRALARVPERPAATRWSVASRIVPGDPFFRMQEAPGEPNARTEITLDGWSDGVGRFTLRPETGKTHQLRLHMARLGWPLLGDRLYPELEPELPDAEIAPLALVAKKLAFLDPITGEARVFTGHRSVEAPTQLIGCPPNGLAS